MNGHYRNLLVAVIVAALGAGISWTRVSLEFNPNRIKVVDSVPVVATDFRVAIDVPRTGLPLTPAALIARIQNEGDTPLSVAITVQSVAICNVSVPAGSTKRIDCAVSNFGPPGLGHVELQGDLPAWTLRYLELSSHHGATRGHDLIIAPAGSMHYRPAGATYSAVVFFVLLVVFLLPQPRMGRVLGTIYRFLAALIWLVAGLTVLSSLISPFLVIVSDGMLWQCAIVLAMPRIGAGVVWCFERRTGWWRTAAQCVGVVVLLSVTQGAVSSRLLTEHYDHNYSGFLRLSKARVERNPILAEHPEVRQALQVSDDHGYDAQYVYFIAFDPFIRRFATEPQIYSEFIDAPSYRFGRIGFCLLTRAVGGNSWHALPMIMVWLVFVGVIASSMSYMSLLAISGANRAKTLLIAAIPAFWQSIQVALPEPVAAAFLLSGYVCYLRGRRRWAGALFASSLLVRETGAVFVLCLVISDWYSGRRRSALILALAAFVPLALWRLYVGMQLSPAFGLDAFWHSTGDFTVPFAGFIDLWGHIGRGDYFSGDAAFARAGFWYPALLISGLGLAGWLLKHSPSPVSAAAAIYGIIAVSLSFGKIWEHIGNGQRGTYELFLMLAVVTAVAPTTLARKFRVALSLFWAATVGYVFMGAFDAEFIRESIGSKILSILF